MRARLHACAESNLVCSNNLLVSDANFRYHAERIIGDEDDDEDVYEVELITDKRVCEKFPRCKLCKKDGEGKAMFVYYIHWKGYSTGTWEHLTDMVGVKTMSRFVSSMLCVPYMHMLIQCMRMSNTCLFLQRVQRPP